MTSPTRSCRGGEPFPSPARIAKAMRGSQHGLLELIATLPDTDEYARALDPDALAGLRCAIGTFAGWRVERQHWPTLRALGLADVREPMLNNFGAAVRAIVMRGDG